MKKIIFMIIFIFSLSLFAQSKTMINIYAPNGIYGNTPPSDVFIYTCIKNSKKRRPKHPRHRRLVYYHLYPDGYYYLENTCRKNYIPYKYRVKPKK